MSPEQAMGEREITAKSDVYALGCVLYEMLTGEPPFTGPTAQAIVARVMTEEPRSLTLQRRTIPRHVEAAVHRALSKLPADRFASAAEFSHALLTPGALTLPAEAAAGFGARARPGLAMWLTGAAALLALAASGFLLGRRTAPAPAPRLTQLVVDAPDSSSAINRCCGAAVALSPDGNTLVFVVAKQGGGMLYRRVLGRIEAEPIPGTEDGATPFFSPDGRWLGFFANGRIRKVALAGGPALPIASIQTMTEASWGEGDVIVFGAGALAAGGARLFTVPAAGGTPQPLTAPDSTTRHSAPALLPGGRAALFMIRDTTSGNEGVRMGLVDLASHKIDTLGFGMRPRYASGYLVFTGADNTLLAQPFDLKRRKPTGQAVAILDHIAIHGNITHEFAVSRNGGLVYQPAGGVIGGERLKLAGSGAASTIALPGRGADNLEDPAFSPDGRRVALRIVASGGGVGSNNDIWLLDRQQGTLERFTVGGGADPVWSRDGRRIAYTSPSGIYVRPADQTAPPQLVIRGGQRSPGSWLPDGRSLVFWDADRGATRSDIGIVTLGDSVPRWLVNTEFRERHPQVSPDGRWLAYSSDLTGLSEVYVQPLSGAGARVQVSTTGGESPRWSPDGRTLYYAVGNSLVGAALAPGAGFQVTGRKTVVENGITDLNVPNVNWDIHPDGKQFLYIDQTGGGNLRIVWILDWPELVRTMATAR
jgi:serine/threonine-protein kinase